MSGETGHHFNSESEAGQAEDHLLHYGWKAGTPDEPTQKIVLELKGVSSLVTSRCCVPLQLNL